MASQMSSQVQEGVQPRQRSVLSHRRGGPRDATGVAAHGEHNGGLGDD
jgi:hypothetical protein